MVFEQALKQRSTNLNFIKTLCAILVIVSHSYTLSLSNSYGDVLYRLTGNKLSLGGFSVAIFLFVSGLYISKSIERKNHFKEYFGARIRKIVPSLFVVVIVTIFILGPLTTSNNIIDYFTNSKTYLYLLNIFFVPIHSLPGVFTNNAYANIVNGSLWTLTLEFGCYIGIYIFYQLNLFKSKRINYFIPIVVIMVILTNYSGINFFTSINSYLRPMYMFFIGMLYYEYKDKITLNPKLFILCLVLFFVSMAVKHPIIGLVFFLPYIICFLSLGLPQMKKTRTGIENASYCIYLVAFPIQQLIVFYNGGTMNVFVNMIMSIVFSLMLGLLLNKYVEEKF